MRIRSKIILIPLVFIPIIVFIYFSHIGKVSSQSGLKLCQEAGVAIDPSKQSDEKACSSEYNTCKNYPLEYLDGWSKCIAAGGGCWDIGRWESIEYTNCPIDLNNNLDYSHEYFSPKYAFSEGNLAYCECVVKCRQQYTKLKDCDGTFKTCCQNISNPPTSTITSTTLSTNLNATGQIDQIEKELPDLCGNEESNKTQIESKTKELVNQVYIEIEQNMKNRIDLSEAQKDQIVKIAKTAIDSTKVQDCGKGSYTDKCGIVFKSDCLYLDPLHSADVIRHELGHIIASTLIKGYQYPTGDSSHEMEGLCSDEHRAFDEALATLIASDIVGKSTYITHKQGNSIDPFTLPSMTNSGSYEIDISAGTVTTKNSAGVKYYGPNGDKSTKLEWYGPSTEAEIDKIADEIKLRFDLIDKEKAKGENADYGLIEGLFRKVNMFLRLLNPPAYSPKSEVAVASLIYDVTGDSTSTPRLGKILKGCENFYNKKGRAPKSELEFLQGFLNDKIYDTSDPMMSSGFSIAYLKINSTDHRRIYLVDSLLLK